MRAKKPGAGHCAGPGVSAKAPHTSNLLRVELRATILRMAALRALLAALIGQTLIPIGDGAHLAILDAKTIQIRLHAPGTTLAKGDIILGGATLVGVANDLDAKILVLDALRVGIQGAAIIGLNRRAIIVEVDRLKVAARGHALDTLAVHAVPTVSAVRVAGALRFGDAISALTNLVCRALVIGQALRAATVIAALLIARAIIDRGAIPNDLLADTGITLQRGISAARVVTALLTQAVDAIKAAFGLSFFTVDTVVVGFTLGIIRTATQL